MQTNETTEVLTSLNRWSRGTKLGRRAVRARALILGLTATLKTCNATVATLRATLESTRKELEQAKARISELESPKA